VKRERTTLKPRVVENAKRELTLILGRNNAKIVPEVASHAQVNSLVSLSKRGGLIFTAPRFVLAES
jgi:hypothetical protein